METFLSAPIFGGGFFYPKNRKPRLFLDFFKKTFCPHLPYKALLQAGKPFSLFLAAWLGLSASSALAVALGPSDLPEARDKEPSPENSGEAAKTISGSRYPGVLDHLMILPANPESDEGGPQVHINYPSTGQKEIDSDIRQWVANLAEIFATHLEVFSLENSLHEEENFSVLPFSENELAEEPQNPEKWELWGDYTISRPSDMAISVTFEIWNYVGNPQGTLDILTLNYNTANGQRLDLVDIFENPEEALKLMSNFSRKQLETRLGAAGHSRMLQDGTEPLTENFSSLTLTQNGIAVNFQPWQVAPWDTGIQKVEIPLTELLAAGPLLALWNK